MLHITGGALVGILLAGCGTSSSGGGDTTAGPGVEGTRGMVFNTVSQDVTLFDPTTTAVVIIIDPIGVGGVGSLLVEVL